MEFTQSLDGYCERLDPGYWAEPINAVTNLAFVVVALLCWRRSAGLPLARLMSFVLGLIGVGSYLFHTHAQVWALILDVLPILGFILLYVYAANRHYWEMSVWVASVGTLAFLPYAAGTAWVFQQMPFFNVSAGYWPVPLLIAIYAILLRRVMPRTARGLGIGAGLLVLSLVFRSLDEMVCALLPIGTHFVWHLLNAVMLGWMIDVYRRHMVAGRVAKG